MANPLQPSPEQRTATASLTGLIPVLRTASVLGLSGLLSACGGQSDSTFPSSLSASPGLSNPPSAAIQVRATMLQAGLAPLVPPADPPSSAQVSLGQNLFFDKELSGNRNISCASCHQPRLGTGDGLTLSIGTGGSGSGPTRLLSTGAFIPRHAPGLLDKGRDGVTRLFWDGSVFVDAQGVHTPAGIQTPSDLDDALAGQALIPFIRTGEFKGHAGDLDVFGQPNEFAVVPANNPSGVWSAALARVVKLPGYVNLLNAAYPTVPSTQWRISHLANALAAYERTTFVSQSTAYDRFLGGSDEALSDSARRGALLFVGKARCVHCHGGPLLSDQGFHNLAAPQVGPGIPVAGQAPLDFGHYNVTKQTSDKYTFRTPPLRDVAHTGPYMHNGAYATLEGVVRHHLNPAQALATYEVTQLDPRLQTQVHTDPVTLQDELAGLDAQVAQPVTLSDSEMDELLAFLYSLTLETPPVIPPDQVPSGLPVSD